MGFKDLARRRYEAGDYEAALSSYTSAIHPDLHCPASEQQILLSNLVACRLKIGGPAQSRAAVENAKSCIALNPNWAKGHVRLASAYVALGGHSNDACNELQRALSLDPGNSTARDMLVRELRRDHAHASSAPASSSRNEGTAAGSNNNNNSNNNANGNPREYPTEEAQDFVPPMDDTLTFWERIQFHWGRATDWYQNQNDDVKTVCKILLVLLVLYVGFGGRFGLSSNTRQLGNYGSDSAYDQYRRYGTAGHSSQSSYPYDRQQSSGYSSQQRRTTHSQNDDYNSNDYSSRRGGSSWGSGFNPFDGSIQSMMLLSGLAYAGHRIGINPWQAMMVLNALGGGHRRFRPRGGFGYGGGGFGYGRRGGFGRRRF
jgi:hypothetical protein